MIRLPLERLLERLAAEIEAAGPLAGGDPYARAQLAAAAEILRNLAPRVQWREDPDLDAAIAGLRRDGEAADHDALRALAARQLDDELTRLRR